MQKDIGRYVDQGVNVAAPTLLAAGTSALATTAGAMTAIVIDRLAIGARAGNSPRVYRSAILSVNYEAILPIAMIATVTMKLQDADGSSGPFADYSTGQQPSLTIGSTSTTVALTLECGGGTTVNNANAIAPDARIPLDLGAARRFLQAVIVPSLQSSSSGSIAIGAKLEFGGAEELASTS